MRALSAFAVGSLLGAAIGALVFRAGLAGALDEIAAQRWWELGLRRLVARELEPALRPVALAALGAGLLAALLSLALRARLSPPRPGRGRRWLAALGWIVLLGLSGTWLWARAAPPSREPERPLDVVWVVLDALRADHLGCYGYAKDTSPFIDSLAAEHFLFEHALSQESYTLASVASYLTSSYPPRTGVLYGKPEIDVLAPSFATLAEVLQDAGYATGAFVFNPHLQSKYRFDQGFDVYDDSAPRFTMKDETPHHERWETGQRMLDKLRAFFEVERERPRFLYLHYRDVHGPYLPPPPYHEAFLPPGVEPVVDLLFWERDRYPLNTEHVDVFLSQYDGEILYNDEYLRRALEFLATQGVELERSIVVVTADHGEEFFDEHPEDDPDDAHGVFHGRTLFTEQVHVPLIVCAPSVLRGPRRVDTSVMLVDIAPTILDLLGLEGAERLGFQGRSLVPLMRGETFPQRAVFSGGNRERALIVRGDWALYQYDRDVKDALEDFHDRPGEGYAPRLGRDLYRLSDDPSMRSDRSGDPEASAVMDRLRAELDDWLAQESSGGEVGELDCETRIDLMELGYTEVTPETLAALVAEGCITRERALEQFGIEPAPAGRGE